MKTNTKKCPQKVLIFGMDGNVFDNYPIKAECAGLAMQKNAQKYFHTSENKDFFSAIYVETSGMNFQLQTKTAYERISENNESINDEVLQKTQDDFRECLRKKMKKVELFTDVEQFLRGNRGNIFTITTTVPITDIHDLVEQTGIDKYFNMICARGGVWHDEHISKIESFDKGPQHYKYILEFYGIEKESVFAISSTRAEIENAISYGLVSIALEHIFNHETLLEFKPNYILKNCLELCNLMEKISNNPHKSARY